MSGSIAPAPVVLDDFNAYSLQVGAARFFRAQADALLHLYAHRGRVLAQATFGVDSSVTYLVPGDATSDPEIKLPTVRSAVDRPVIIALVAEPACSMSLKVTASDHDGSNATSATLSTIVGTPRSLYGAAGVPGIAFVRPGGHPEVSFHLFRTTLSTSTVNALWSLNPATSGIGRFTRPMVSSVLLVEEEPTSGAGI